MSYKRKTRESSGGLEEKDSGWPADDPCFRYASLISKQDTSSKRRDLNMQIQGCHKLPTSGEARTKWRTGTSKCVSINSNQKHVLKTVS